MFLANILGKVSGVYGSIRNYITLGLVVVVLFLAGYWYVTDLKLISARHQVDTEKALRKADQESYKAAQAKAEANALMAKAKQEKIDRDNAEKADASYRALLSKYNASLVHFAQSQRATSYANMSGQAKSPEVFNRPSADTFIPQTVNITFDDAQVCAENTARLQAAHDWAVSK